MRESKIEAYLVKRVKAAGGEIRKVKWIGRANAPDRLVLLNGATFIELKASGEKARAAQVREHQRMEKHGVKVEVFDCVEDIDLWMLFQAAPINPATGKREVKIRSALPVPTWRKQEEEPTKGLLTNIEI